MERLHYLQIIRDLAFKHRKMAFLAGPRQVGKTTLARQMERFFDQTSYHNWDDIEFKKIWLKKPSSLIPEKIGGKNLLILDELHKAPKWKNTLKGLYDIRGSHCSILVTGSARLDLYRRGGDSMLGRYFLFRLHPFSVGEINGHPLISPDKIPSLLLKDELLDNSQSEKLFEFGGFPDPFLNNDKKYHLLWRQGRIERLVREDLVDLSRLRETAMMQTLMALLPEKVGSPLSIQSLAEDLDTNHPSVKRWLGWLEQIYYAYLIPPYSRRISQSLKKQPKLYLWDWSEIPDEAARFENMVAGHLLKAVHFWNDTGEGKFVLFYLRDKLKREVDFLITKDQIPWMIMECKLTDKNLAPALVHFSKVLRPRITLQVIKSPGVQNRIHQSSDISAIVISADKFLGLLP